MKKGKKKKKATDGSGGMTSEKIMAQWHGNMANYRLRNRDITGEVLSGI